MTKPAKTVPYTCLCCGANDFAVSTRKQFCDNKCAVKYKRKMLKSGEPTGYVTCKFCREEFPYWQAYDDVFYAGNRKKFCGYSCSNSYTKLKNKEDVDAGELQEEEPTTINRGKHCIRDGIKCKHYEANWLRGLNGTCLCELGYSPEVLEKKDTGKAYDSILGGHEYSTNCDY